MGCTASPINQFSPEIKQNESTDSKNAYLNSVHNNENEEFELELEFSPESLIEKWRKEKESEKNHSQGFVSNPSLQILQEELDNERKLKLDKSLKRKHTSTSKPKEPTVYSHSNVDIELKKKRHRVSQDDIVAQFPAAQSVLPQTTITNHPPSQAREDKLEHEADSSFNSPVLTQSEFITVSIDYFCYSNKSKQNPEPHEAEQHDPVDVPNPKPNTPQKKDNAPAGGTKTATADEVTNNDVDLTQDNKQQPNTSHHSIQVISHAVCAVCNKSLLALTYQVTSLPSEC